METNNNNTTTNNTNANKMIIKVGMDVHLDIFRVCMMERTLVENRLLKRGEMDPKPKLVVDFVKGVLKDLGLKKSDCVIELGYEAGCFGYSLYWEFKKLKYDCVILAPTSLTQPKGIRQKNDVRDAERIANDMCNRTCSYVHVPSKQDAAVNDFLALRQDAAEEVKRIKQQLNAFTVRQGFHYTKTKWTGPHYKWLNELKIQGIEREVLDGYLTRLTIAQGQVDEYDRRIKELAELDEYKDDVSNLQCFLGVRDLTALSLKTGLSDCFRFPTANHLAGYLGLVPRENSSGLTPTLGSITKAGNVRLRTLLIEAAAGICKGRVGYKSKDLKARQSKCSPEVVAYADRANIRLRQKYYDMIRRGVKRNVAVVAVARELACFIWGMMTGNIAPRAPKGTQVPKAS